MSTAMKLRLSTGYMIEPIGAEGTLRPHQLSLATSACTPLMGKLVADPNVCGLDALGDPTICTRMAQSVHRATLSLIEERDGKALYAIEVEGYSGPALRLALLPGRGADGGMLARLLVLDDDGKLQRVINMEGIPEPPSS